MNINHNDEENTHSYVALAKGTKIDHYLIIEKIGAGGMGEVYLAEDTELKRKVALKFLPLNLCQNEDYRARFKREAQATAALKHPNIVTIYEVSEFQNRPFFAMEYINGNSLRNIIKGNKLSISDVIDLMIQVCAGLNEAHEAGIVHRDIKPGNIIIDKNNRLYLLDFGLATIAGEEKLTKTGSTLGTVGYMSPEQVKGEKTDHRSDLFSAGVVLYEMITGRLPFEAEHEAAIHHNIVNKTPEPMARYKSDVTDELQQIIDKALAKDPSLRYQHADGMLSDLKRLKSISRPARKSGFGRWAVGSFVLIAITALLLWRFWYQTPVTDAIPMIAVLPFDNLGHPDDEYFADGITEEITSRLAGIQGLGVISRTSAIKFKNTDKQIKEIGRELGVDYILEGTIRWSKDKDYSRVRITPQLIRVSDDCHLWASNYERELMDVFEVQADIALQIVENLGVTILEKDRLALGARLTENPEAYKYYLRGVDLIKRIELRQQPVLEAVAMFDSAIALDPEFAMAYAYRSGAKSVCCFQMFGDIPKFAVQALQDAKKALILQPDLAFAHFALGIYKAFVGRDYNGAMEEFSNIYSELHNNPVLFMGIALVQMRQGKFDMAVDNFQRAVELDPLNPVRYQMLYLALLYNGQYKQAETAIDRAIWLEKTRPDFYSDKIFLYASWYGDLDKMRQVVDDAKTYVDPMAIILTPKWLNFDIIDIPLDSQLIYINNSSVENMAPYQYYGNLARIYAGLGRLDLAASYADSTRSILEMMIERMPQEADLHAMLSFTLAGLGRYNDAIDEAQKAKELMTVDDCHW